MSRRSRIVPWLLLAVAVLVGAIGQAATAVPGLGLMPTGWFAVVAAASAILLLGQIVAVAWATAVIVDPAGPRALGPLIAWAAVISVVGAAVAVMSPLALAVVAVFAMCVLPAAARGRWNALTGFVVYRVVPVRAVLATISLLVACLLMWAVALVTGFFITGYAGALAMWAWFGIASSGMLLSWSALLARSA